MKAAQALYGIDDAHCFTDFKDLINCPEVDAVDICTPNYLHFPVAKYAIEAGKPYNLEKPVGVNAEEANTLAEMTKEKGLAHMVCFSYGFKAAARLCQRFGTVWTAWRYLSCTYAVFSGMGHALSE